MIVAGVMSGTSADGINVAFVRFREPGRRSSSRENSPPAGIDLLGHAEFPYPKPVRRSVLAAMNAEKARVADLSRLNFLLGELYAEAVLATQRRFRLKPELIGCHGQTLYHQGEAARFLGHDVSCTWQAGEGAIIAARTGVPVVCDFRPADIAAGGQGAPLVPFLDYALYRDPHAGRIVQNIGGIANLTAISAGAVAGRLIAFDTGPGNMVIDAVAGRLFHRPYDRNGEFAASGMPIETVLRQMLRLPFFRRRPPKTAGREQFGREYVSNFLRRCGRARKNDVIATATALTARSIAGAVKDFVLSSGHFRELIVSGGGARNSTLMAMLANGLKPHQIELRLSDEFGLPSEAKEAVAFALLAYETWQHRAANVPAATGARKSAILGKISYP